MIFIKPRNDLGYLLKAKNGKNKAPSLTTLDNIAMDIGQLTYLKFNHFAYSSLQ